MTENAHPHLLSSCGMVHFIHENPESLMDSSPETDEDAEALQQSTITPPNNTRLRGFKRPHMNAFEKSDHRPTLEPPFCNEYSITTGGVPPETEKLTRGKQKIPIEFIHDRTRRYSTFSKRKTGMMKKAVELAELTGAEVLLLIASETNHVYTFATKRLKGIIDLDSGKELIRTCLSADYQSPSSKSDASFKPGESNLVDMTPPEEDSGADEQREFSQTPSGTASSGKPKSTNSYQPVQTKPDKCRPTPRREGIQTGTGAKHTPDSRGYIAIAPRVQSSGAAVASTLITEQSQNVVGIETKSNPSAQRNCPEPDHVTASHNPICLPLSPIDVPFSQQLILLPSQLSSLSNPRSLSTSVHDASNNRPTPIDLTSVSFIQHPSPNLLTNSPSNSLPILSLASLRHLVHPLKPHNPV
ncbi:unnamed protein product [Calicophoron daubneyi]|uniref:MADS-box domain-containing protein n=1 Tax=Calicophoron daubneyi TaxID=300641 RepID=A0AAV2TW03_CALDB